MSDETQYPQQMDTGEANTEHPDTVTHEIHMPDIHGTDRKPTGLNPTGEPEPQHVVIDEQPVNAYAAVNDTDTGIEAKLREFLDHVFPNDTDTDLSPVDNAIRLLQAYADSRDGEGKARNAVVGANVVYHPLHPTLAAEGTASTVEDGAVFHNGVTVDDVLAATITRVTDLNVVNLIVYSDGGGLLHKKGVTMGDGFGQWEWPAA